MTLGDWPTPVRAVRALGGELWFKCEGDAHPLYGGNKVRTLEAWFGHARARHARRLWSIGAFGSNHVIATVLHGQRIGLPTGAILFPQPASAWAIENCSALVASGAPIVRLPSIVAMPFAALRHGRDGDVVMPPGGASTIGTFGALAAAFELAAQLDAGLAPAPARIVLAVGSTCTTAGLLAGIALAL
ncbi:MAG: pyridoxal-phosphate dependent enzyme, partial [Proteobacteria bacterium]|nr:pyridoxal-phosphate dependent enzyme [Pseudomonadota bacterium]